MGMKLRKSDGSFGKIRSFNPQVIVESGGTLLLDTYPADAAYSLRKLRSAYNGYAIRVRRSSDNAEMDIGFVGNELDTATLLTFASGGSCYVTIWYDQSGNELDAIQGTAANQPRIVNAGVVDRKNGHVALYTNLASATSFSINHIAGKSTIYSFICSDSDADTRWIYLYEPTSRFSYVSENGSSNTLFYSLYGTPSLYVNSILRSPTNRGDVYTETSGYNLITEIGSTTSWSSASILGYPGGYDFDGYFYQAVFYFSNQSSNRAAIESNINGHYSIY